eukprot:4626439-Pyramimonas_sp.AAC.1
MVEKGRLLSMPATLIMNPTAYDLVEILLRAFKDLLQDNSTAELVEILRILWQSVPSCDWFSRW